jgi:hypothetical protein
MLLHQGIAVVSSRACLTPELDELRARRPRDRRTLPCAVQRESARLAAPSDRYSRKAQVEGNTISESLLGDFISIVTEHLLTCPDDQSAHDPSSRPTATRSQVR